MAERKSFLLRVDRETLDAVQRWANDDLRSLNGQIEFLLRRALQQTGRAPKGGVTAVPSAGAAGAAEEADVGDDVTDNSSPNTSGDAA